MADTKISALPAGTVAPTSVLPAVNGAVTQKVTVQQLLDIVGTVEGPAGPPGADGAPGVDGPAGESVTVFEQPTAPVALRTGDIWLEPIAAPVTGKDGLTIEEVEAVVASQISKLPPAATVDTAAIASAVLAELTKGNKQWTRCVEITAGFGVTLNVFARVLNGVMYVRGSYAAPFGLGPATRIGLPSGFPSPAFDMSFRVIGRSTGSPELLSPVMTFKPDGGIYFDADGCNTIIFDGISFPVT